MIATRFFNGKTNSAPVYSRQAGLITAGDVQAHDDFRGPGAADVMTASPATIDPGARLQDALRMMEDRSSQVSVLPVVDRGSGACLGLLRLHDIYRGGSILGLPGKVS